MSNQATGNSAHQPREGFMAPTFRIFVRTAEGAEFQAFTWCRDEASGIARAWRESAQWQLKAQFPKWTDKPVCVEYEMRRPRAGADIDNRAKPLGDALTGVVLKDDSQIVDLRIRWADVEGVHIIVRAA